MSNPSVAGGDGIAYRAELDRRERRDRRLLSLKLEYLEETYRHELMDDEERQELRDRVITLRRRLGPRLRGEGWLGE